MREDTKITRKYQLTTLQSNFRLCFMRMQRRRLNSNSEFKLQANHLINLAGV
jgi:hypothetical protein